MIITKKVGIAGNDIVTKLCPGYFFQFRFSCTWLSTKYNNDRVIYRKLISDIITYDRAENKIIMITINKEKLL